MQGLTRTPSQSFRVSLYSEARILILFINIKHQGILELTGFPARGWTFGAGGGGAGGLGEGARAGQRGGAVWRVLQRRKGEAVPTKLVFIHFLLTLCPAGSERFFPT